MSYKIKCKYCEKDIEGLSKEQAEHYYKMHLISKHIGDVEIKEIKKEKKCKN